MKRVAPFFLALLLALADPAASHAQLVFAGDPVDPSTGRAYPVMPGLPLLLPGDDEKFGTGDDLINTGITGDVDLVVRAGTVLSSAVPPPARAAGGAPISTIVAGGGTIGDGTEASFTVMASDGSGSPPYGNVLAGSDLDLRPVTIYAFADLDGDGVIGPSNADGASDNAIEMQEVTSYAGRQMGSLDGGRFLDSLGIELAAPASIGGLDVALVAGAWTGSDPEQLFTDGPFIVTRWPMFPPIDPKDLIGGGHPPAPDPEVPSELEWDIETNYLPAPGHPVLGTPFALSTNGSEPSTDQVVVVSGAAVSARVFATPAASSFLARSRPRLRVAPPAAGTGRVVVLDASRVSLAADGAATQLALRVLPVDLFANVADPAAALGVTLSMSGPASIVSPDSDGNPKTETLSLSTAKGAAIVLDDAGSGRASLVVSVAGSPVETVAVTVGSAPDFDGDSASEDGNGSRISGDRPCDASAAGCDDNCPMVINPSQADSDHDGIGDCCDGTCLVDPLVQCGECALPVGPTAGGITRAGVKARSGDDEDRLTVKLAFDLPTGSGIAPDAETVTLAVTQSGNSGFSASLPSLMTDLMRSAPAYRYVDRTGSVDGVTKAQIKGSPSGSYTAGWKVRGPGIAGLAAGPATISLTIGDDTFEAALECSASGARISCELAP